MRALPAGTVTFLFTDIEGSTRLLHELGDGYSAALAEHHRLLREVWARHGGVEVDTAGDAFFVAFADATAAVAAATDAQAALGQAPLRVRIGLHTGEPAVGETGYVGADVHLAARISAAAHGGQIVLSRRTKEAAAAAAVDLGEHRVKDFAAPVWLFQVGSESFPPLRTIGNTNVPRPASSFVGREREVEEVVAMLRSPARLVTLTGPGGTGKTRLAIAAASVVVGDYPNGVFWVSLAPLRDAAVVLDEVARVVGAKHDLAGHFAGKRGLLLLDNFEQVVAAAAKVADLVECAPGLDVLVTSRELLRVRGEVELEIAPLENVDAVALFCARARVEADETVVELCRRLDNLPLAVELAAARVKLFTPAQLVARLGERLDLLRGGRDADPRQQTLRATIEWSHGLLEPVEQRLFARLAAFAGGCTFDAAEDVAGADPDTLQSLVEKNLVRRTETRFWMLETIMEFARERLEAQGEAADLAGIHAAWYAAYSTRSFSRVRFGDAVAAAEFMDELPNVRSAVGAALQRGDVAVASDLLLGSWYVWLTRGMGHELRRWVDAYLALREGPSSAATFGGDLAASETLRYTGHPERAAALKRRLIDLAQREPQIDLHGSPAPRVAGALLTDLAYYELERGGLAAAQKHAEDALAARLADEHPIAHVLQAFASIAYAKGDYVEARDRWLESARGYRELGHSDGAADNELAAAACEALLGRLAEAAALARGALADVAAAGVHAAIGSAFGVVASIADAAGDPRSAFMLARMSFRLEEEGGAAFGLSSARERLRAVLERASGGLSPDALAEAEARADELDPAGALTLARAVVEHASVRLPSVH